MFHFINRLLQPFGPEQTERWNQRKWDAWFQRSARLYYRTSDLATKRGAFAPFLVEPLSSADPATQLFREMQDYVPAVADRLAFAAAHTLSTWSPVDGGPLAEFMLRLLRIVGGDLDPGERLYSDLATVVARLGPPLGEQALQQVLQEAVECAVTRLNVQQLRELGALIERRCYVWRIPVWRAQFRLLSALSKTGGLEQLFVNIAAVSPRLPEFVGDQIVKHYAADIFVDSLGLKNIPALMDFDNLSAEQEEIRNCMRYCIIGYRVSDNGKSLKDKLYESVVEFPAREAELAQGNVIFAGERFQQRLQHDSMFARRLVKAPR